MDTTSGSNCWARKGLLQAGTCWRTTVVRFDGDGVVSGKPTYFFLERYMPAYAAKMGRLRRRVLDGRPQPVTLADGIAALALAEAATRDARTGETVPLQG